MGGQLTCVAAEPHFTVGSVYPLIQFVVSGGIQVITINDSGDFQSVSVNSGASWQVTSLYTPEKVI